MLKWHLPAALPPDVEHWQYEQRQCEQTDEPAARQVHSTGSTATTHAVSGLTNGVSYCFRVRSVLKHGTDGCWSNSVSVTPTQPGNVLEEMATHQQEMAAHQGEMAAHQGAIVGLQREIASQQREMTTHQGDMAKQQREIARSTRAIASGMEDDRELLKDLGERGVEAIGEVAASVDRVGDEAEHLREEVALIAAGINRVAESVDIVGDKTAHGLAGIERQLMKTPPAARPELCDGEEIGSVYFAHDSYDVYRMAKNRAAVSEIANVLEELDAGAVVLAVGYANAVGTARHNLHLSDLRAACAIHCLRRRLGKLSAGFQFREVAKGEEADPSDPTGTSQQSQRVDVRVCQGTALREWPVADESWAWADMQACGCS